MAAVIKSHVWDGKMVHAIYTDVVNAALKEPIALDTIKDHITNAPDVEELRVLRTTCKAIVAGENAGKFAVRATLRYVPKVSTAE